MRKHPGISIIGATGLAAGLLAGCTTLRKPIPVPPLPTMIAPESPESSLPGAKSPLVSASKAETPPAPAPSSPGAPTTAGKPATGGTAAVAGSYLLSIDSAPTGALIVVNEQPVGKAPLRLAVKGTPAGFFKDYLTIRARFLADSPQEVSSSVAQNFTPLDKIPVKLTFTPQGAQRQLRE